MGEVDGTSEGYLSELAAAPNRRTLTDRETEVLRWYSHGLTRKMVASVMGISAETVKSHCEAARSKLAAKNMLHAVAIAFRLGLID